MEELTASSHPEQWEICLMGQTVIWSHNSCYGYGAIGQSVTEQSSDHIEPTQTQTPVYVCKVKVKAPHMIRFTKYAISKLTD